MTYKVQNLFSFNQVHTKPDSITAILFVQRVTFMYNGCLYTVYCGLSGVGCCFVSIVYV